ncbi:MAG: NUDIX hydrolase [Gemmataceae bacterium]
MARKKHAYDYPRPAVTVDVALFTVAGALQNLRLRTLLIERGGEPFAGSWALPGGFVREGEDLPAAAARELEEETGVSGIHFEQLGAVGTPGRDPRGDTVTVVYVGLVPGDRCLRASGDAAEARWWDTSTLPPLAFDHAGLLAAALAHLRRRVGEAPLCFELLPAEFTLSEFQALLEAILGRAVDRRNFRRRVLELGLVAETGGTKREGAHRPARLFRGVPAAYDRMRERELPF